MRKKDYSNRNFRMRGVGVGCKIHTVKKIKNGTWIYEIFPKIV